MMTRVMRRTTLSVLVVKLMVRRVTLGVLLQPMMVGALLQLLVPLKSLLLILGALAVEVLGKSSS